MEKIGALEEAIQQKSLAGIYSVFYTIAHGDPNFSTGKFMETLSYVKSKNIEGLMQEFDGEELREEAQWDQNYWAYIASSLMDNFCDVRIEHLCRVGQKVYPAVQKQIQPNVRENRQPAAVKQPQNYNSSPGREKNILADMTESLGKKLTNLADDIRRGKRR